MAFAGPLSKFVKDELQYRENLEKTLAKESEEAILANQDAIREALLRRERFVVTLPCQYRLIISPQGEVSFDPCSESMVV